MEKNCNFKVKKVSFKCMKNYLKKNGIIGDVVKEGNVWYEEWIEDGVVNRYKLIEMKEVDEKGYVNRRSKKNDGYEKNEDIMYVKSDRVVYYCYVKLWNYWVWDGYEMVLVHDRYEKLAARKNFEKIVWRMARDRSRELYSSDLAA